MLRIARKRGYQLKRIMKLASFMLLAAELCKETTQITNKTINMLEIIFLDSLK
jgi:uncharacterized membrane protein (UPF0127 family)